jgi:hypothetical protein
MKLSFKERLAQRAKTNREAFLGTYKKELDELQGLSRAEIDAITTDTSGLEIYAQLIEIVKEASASNESNAVLKEQIVELGAAAIKIAKKVPSISKLIV